MDARRFIERINLETRIVGDADEACRLRIVPCLQRRVLRECRARLLGLFDWIEIVQGDKFDRDTVENPGDLVDLAGVRGRDQQFAQVVQGFYWATRISPTIERCKSTSSRMPWSARARRSSRARRSKGGPSAVPCTSMNLPSPVLTTFMSTSARESSS